MKPDPLPGPNQGRLNLKLTGTLPLVGAIRIMALRDRIQETGTVDRIAALHACGVLDDDQQEYLSGAYRHISTLLMRQQLEDYRAGLLPGNHVPLDAPPSPVAQPTCAQNPPSAIRRRSPSPSGINPLEEGLVLGTGKGQGGG